MNGHLNCADSQDKDLLAKFNITHILSIHDTAKPVLEVSHYVPVCLSQFCLSMLPMSVTTGQWLSYYTPYRP